MPAKPIPFEAFMQHALHDPNQGYYSRNITAVGGRGDFTTAPMLSEALARALARWASQALQEADCRDLIEIGPGTGQLAHHVWKHLPWPLRWRCRLHLVETSAPLLAIQKKRLKNRATWHATPEQALASCRGKAVIFSNELVDAFAVRRFEKTNPAWQEVAVALDHDGSAAETLIPCETLPHSSIFSREFPRGQKVEVHESYHRWLSDWLPHWKAGRMLTIDYGAEADALYQRQPNGSVRAYLLQQRLEGPAIYQNIGRQDLTADVNFTDLISWSRPWAETLSLQSLSEFLTNHSRNPDPQLIDPDGAGGAFRVLDQSCRS